MNTKSNSESLGSVDFCPSCRHKIDMAINSADGHRLYIAINRDVKPPNGRIPIYLCIECETLLRESLGIDGFQVVQKQ